MNIRRYLQLGAVAALVIGFAGAASSPAAQATPRTIEVSGTIAVIPVESAAQEAARPADPNKLFGGPAADGVTVRVVTADGDWFTVTGPAVRGAATGSRFDGTLRVPAALAASSKATNAAEIAKAASDRRVAMPVESATIAPPRTTSASASAMQHTVDVMFLARSTGELPAASVLDAQIARLSTFWSSQSGGKISKIARTKGIVRQAIPSSRWDICDMGVAEPYAAQRFGRSESDYLDARGRHLLILIPAGTCDWGGYAGFGTLGSSVNSGGIMNVMTDVSRLRLEDSILFHEFGHNISLMHSGLRECWAPGFDAASRLTEASHCEDDPYGDYYDVMGGGTLGTSVAALNAAHRAELGSLPAADLRTVTEAGGNGQAFTIKPADATTGLRGLAITDPLTREKIYVEYRYPTGIDKGSYYDTGGNTTLGPGVRFLRALSRSGNPSSTVLGRWATTGQPDDAERRLYWRTWDTLMTYNNAVSVQVQSQSPTGAKVVVSFRATPRSFTTVPRPGIASSPSGQPVWGSVLKPTGAAARDFAPKADLVDYQWRRDGAPIRNGDGFTYTVTADDVGHSITVRAIAHRSGWKAASNTSAPIRVSNLNVTRLAGANRYETAVKISETAYPPPATTTTLYLATGAKFADALSAAPAAAKEKAPLLLVPPSGTIPQAVTGRIAALAPNRIVVVGGTSSVSDSVVAQVRAIRPAATIQRIAGPDRYATSRAVVAAAFSGTTPAHVYVATGRTFPDALAASGAAGANGEPVILVDGKAGNLNADTTNLINTLRPSRAYVTGGYGTVSGGIQNALAARYPTTRLYGPDRYATAVEINDAAFPGSNVPNHQWATGSDFPDALAGATLAAVKRGPLYLVKRDCVPFEVGYAATTKRVAAITLLGGTSTLGTPVQRLEVCFTGGGD